MVASNDDKRKGERRKGDRRQDKTHCMSCRRKVTRRKGDRRGRR